MSRRFKIIRTDCELECPTVDRVLRDAGTDLVLLPETVSRDDLARTAEDADLILMCYTPIPAEVINRAARLRGIVKYGVGIDAIDIDAARARSVPVVNIPEYGEETVAEAAFALMIALAKKLLPIHSAMQSESWIWPNSQWIGSDLAGKTLGLVGAGRIGRSMARMSGAGFNMKVLGFDPHLSAAQMHAAGIEKSDLHEMLGQADFVSVHCVLNDETRHLIGESELRLMKPSAMLINVSRGAIIDETALLEALQCGVLAGAGLDVFSREPLSRSGHALGPLYEMENVILTPHLAFYTREAMHRLEADVLERCFELLEGKRVLIKSRDPRLTSQEHGVRFR